MAAGPNTATLLPDYLGVRIQELDGINAAPTRHVCRGHVARRQPRSRRQSDPLVPNAPETFVQLLAHFMRGGRCYAALIANVAAYAPSPSTTQP